MSHPMSHQGPGQTMPPGPPGPPSLMMSDTTGGGMSRQGAGQVQPWQGAAAQRGDPLEDKVQERVLQEQEADMQLALCSG